MRLLDRLLMCTWISGVLLVSGSVCVMRAARLSRLAAISSCLDECKSGIGVDPSGRLREMMIEYSAI